MKAPRGYITSFYYQGVERSTGLDFEFVFLRDQLKVKLANLRLPKTKNMG